MDTVYFLIQLPILESILMHSNRNDKIILWSVCKRIRSTITQNKDLLFTLTTNPIRFAIDIGDVNLLRHCNIKCDEWICKRAILLNNLDILKYAIANKADNVELSNLLSVSIRDGSLECSAKQ